MRSVEVMFALCLAPSMAVAQSATDHVEVCGHAVRVDHGSVGGLRAGPVALGEGVAALEALTLTGGSAVIVTVSREGAPVEGLVATCANGAAPALAWHGSLRWRGEDVGDRARDEIASREIDGRREIVIARRSESPALCGVGAVLSDASRVEPATATLTHLAAIDPLEGAAHGATGTASVEAATAAAVAYAPRNVVTSAGEAHALFDHTPTTAWIPGPNGFATVTLPSTAFTLRALDVTPAPRPAATVRRWALLAEPGAQRYDFELPARPLLAGGVWRVTLPAPIAVRCVALVARGAQPGAGVGEVALRSALDEGPDALATLVHAVDAADGDMAASLLVEIGPAGTHALASGVAQLSALGARRALRALSTSRSPEALSALVAALDRDETAEAAADGLRRAGPTALDALMAVAATSPRAASVIAATSAPVVQRLRALAPALTASHEVWTAARPALASLLAAASREHLGDEWMALIPDDPSARSRALHATAEAFPADDPLRAPVAATARGLWAAHDDFDLRYRLLLPLTGDAEGVAIVTDVLARDADHDLRAEAARVLGAVSASTSSLRSALHDRIPRVRVAVAESLRNRHDAIAVLIDSLTNDRWPSVRAAAANALATEREAAPALEAALDAHSTVTVRAVIAALAENPSQTVTRALVAFLDEGRRAASLRREAAEALGSRCDRSAANDLERVAEGLTDPALPPWEQEVGHTALASLARLDPQRARAFLTRSEANSEAVSAMERAARRGCPAR